MASLKVYRVQLPDHLVEQVDFLILARTMRLAKWNAQNLLIHRGYKHWAQIYIDAVDSATAEALIGNNPDSYVIHNQPPTQSLRERIREDIRLASGLYGDPVL